MENKEKDDDLFDRLSVRKKRSVLFMMNQIRFYRQQV